ncbi:MAG: hypothetical protein HFJ34_02895 [Clostridia bacterium]|nr:hypothetical protein [Clostridia bacterium]
MNQEKLYDLIDNIPITLENAGLIEEIKSDIANQDYTGALQKIQQLGHSKNRKPKESENEYDEDEEIEEKNEPREEKNNQQKFRKSDIESMFPQELSNQDLERQYIGLLLLDPRLIKKYFYLYEECYFEDLELLNIYKSIIFTEGGAYTSEVAKRGFNFAKDDERSYQLKGILKKEIRDKNYNIEKIYMDLKKLFVLRKNYLAIPIQNIQEKVIEIKEYELYDKMSVEEIESAVIQVNDTEKFKRAVLNKGLTSFLELGDNNLTSGLPLPFPTLTQVFKGIRKGETMAFAMPSNSGKSRFTINLAAHTAFVHQKKVLIISNEMSEEKMRLCLITTILNNKEIQKIHGIQISKTEGELLEFKFRPEKGKKVEVDENGFVKKEEKEKQKDFVKRLLEVSKEFRDVIGITNWVNQQIKNCIYFINITDHTNDELKKVIMNYYYKEKIEYVFYDTLKTDTANIGIGEELKKTATILSNIAQNFGIYICSTLQLAESDTLPVNLTVNDLAVSRTVKEVLDTLALIKQINRDNLENYEYSLNEVDTKFFNLQKFDDPDVRYYACVVDKNRAGAKPTLLFRLNLAYNVWEELGYLRLKQ